LHQLQGPPPGLPVLRLRWRGNRFFSARFMSTTDRRGPEFAEQGRHVRVTTLPECTSRAAEELPDRNGEAADRSQRALALREALERADGMAVAEQTVTSVARQIGTPLNLISGYVQMIREQEGADSPMGQRLKIVEDQIAKVALVLRTIQNRTRQRFVRALTDPVRLVEQVCEVVRPRLDRARIHLDVRTAGVVPEIDADPIQVGLALMNLITSSLGTMPAGGTLTVAVSRDGSRVRVEIGDTGSGMAPELLPHVFEPWVATKTAGLDPGLGLSIAKNVVEAHGGAVDVRSEPGKGTVFTIDLPAAPPTSSRAA
jgi:signal transduction histidine kinase